MKKIILMKILIFLFLLFPSFSLAQTSLWSVKKNMDTVYIGGTIHLLRKSDYPLPPAFDAAYNDSDVIYFETDLNELNQPSIQNSIISKMTLKNGEKLSSLLSKQTYKELEDFAASRGVNLKDYDQFKPAMILLTLTVMELQSMGINTDGVDKFYLTKALKDKKPLGKLEGVDKHLNYMSSMGEGNEDKFIRQSLKDFNRTKKYFSRIIKAWRMGSTGALYKLFVKDLKKKFPQLYFSLLVERNNNWVPVIQSMFENDDTEFVLVGVAHLIGADGVLQQLRRKGYKVKQLK